VTHVLENMHPPLSQGGGGISRYHVGKIVETERENKVKHEKEREERGKTRYNRKKIMYAIKGKI
jgi:hypothetical protein